MAVYDNQTYSSALTAVEFAPVLEGNFTFFYVDKAENTQEVKTWITSPAMQQEIIAQTEIDGHPALITHGNKSQKELMQAIEERGNKLALHHASKGISDLAWPLRSALGIAGQSLQLSSSLLRGKRDWGLFAFAVSNLTANGINVLFGAQREEDINRLRFLKTEINNDLQQHAADGQTLPDINKRQILHTSKSASEKVNGFFRRHSVSVGELGLRYFGALALVIPANNWKKAAGALTKGNFRELRTLQESSALRRYAGLGSILGKSVALFSKPTDPYSSKPHTTLDTIREKYTFRTGGWIETAAFAALAYDGFTHQKVNYSGFKKPAPDAPPPKLHADYLSGLGASLFTAAYVIRHWAKFSVKETDMEELYAHVSDSLAKMPPEQLPQLMADTAGFIKENFKEKNLDYGKIFTDLALDLHRYHRIALNSNKQPVKGEAPVAKTAAVAAQPAAEKPAPRIAPERFAKPAGSRTEALAKSADTPEYRAI